MSAHELPHEEGVASERDFYRRLLDLGGQREIEPLLGESLALIVEVTGASVAYLELYDDDSTQPRYWKGYRLSDHDVASIRASISRGIIARAITDGRTIETPSASLDDRFSDLGSVRQHAIQAVLCAPGRRRPADRRHLPAGADPARLVHRRPTASAPSCSRGSSRRSPTGSSGGAIADRIDHTREVRERLRCQEIVGRSRALAQLLHSASHVAPLDVDVLITGPSGTGKSMLARTLAQQQPAQPGPFVELNCAAMPEALIENELFGAERGAHSTATRKVAGKVAAAEGGTLFLDEIAELPAGCAGQAAPAPRDPRVPRARLDDVAARGRPDHQRDEREPRGARRGQAVPRGPVLPHARGAARGAGPRRSAATTSPSSSSTSAPSRASATSSRRSPCRAARSRRAATRRGPGHTRQLAHAIEAAVIRAHGEKLADAARAPRVSEGRARGPSR